MHFLATLAREQEETTTTTTVYTARDDSISTSSTSTAPLPVDILGDGSILKTIIEEGEGNATPQQGAGVVVDYTGTLADGTEFDSSRSPGRSPFEFNIGSGVIQGWSEGVATMKKGERAIFVLAPEKAYGVEGYSSTIPGDATLKFDIKLISFDGDAAPTTTPCITVGECAGPLSDAGKRKKGGAVAAVVLLLSVAVATGVVLRKRCGRFGGGGPTYVAVALSMEAGLVFEV
jgi:FKBP-type peptidyl-prolyl cis-trans isomerase